MKKVVCAGWILVLAALLTACGQNPPRPSEVQQAAVQWNQRAQAAYARGDYAQALAHYQQALAVNRAIEDVDGIARELINLSTVYRKLGQRDSARASLDAMLTAGGIPFTPAQRAEATYRLALHAAEDGDAAAAQALSDQALVLCAACPAEGAMRNFQAGLRLAAGDAATARELARRALEINRRHGDRVEEANSLRLLADAALRLQDPTIAAESYRQALAIDKIDGAPHKIAADLIGLGQAELARGKRAEAADYFARARSVADAAGDNVGRQQAETLLRGAKP
ncbi:MAG: tetratricopeptide repeat protein [Gammaproteobacteria bacterium]|nr:tetratricopeptide repeat protein [Gammaproteobacteria bacterium]